MRFLCIRSYLYRRFLCDGWTENLCNPLPMLLNSYVKPVCVLNTRMGSFYVIEIQRYYSGIFFCMGCYNNILVIFIDRSFSFYKFFSINIIQVKETIILNYYMLQFWMLSKNTILSFWTTSLCVNFILKNITFDISVIL